MCRYLMFFLVFPMTDVSLTLQIPCTAKWEEGVEYQKITWYRVLIGSGSLVGLVRKDISTDTTQHYKFANYTYQIGTNFSLLNVPEHNQENCVIYRCCLWPPVGQRILQSDYSLPQGCQRNAVIMAELSTPLQGTNQVLSLQNLVIAAGVLLLAVVNVTVVVCLCKQRKKSKSRIC